MGATSRAGDAEAGEFLNTIAQCREIGVDAAAWRLHMLRGLMRITHLRVGIAGEVRWSGRPAGMETRGVVDAGWSSAAARRCLREFMTESATKGEGPWSRMRAVIGAAHTAAVTVRRRDLFDPRSQPAWTRAGTAAVMADYLVSLARIGGSRWLDVIVLGQRAGGRPVSTAQRRRVERFHAALRPHLGRGLATAGEPGVVELSPRLRETLWRLLEGDGEKQIARALGVSFHTAHQYVTMLYRHFGVSGRAELMARFLRLQIGPARKWIMRMNGG